MKPASLPHLSVGCASLVRDTLIIRHCLQHLVARLFFPASKDSVGSGCFSRTRRQTWLPHWYYATGKRLAEGWCMMSCVSHLSGTPPGSCRFCPLPLFLGKRVQGLGSQAGLGPPHLHVWQNTAHKHIQGQHCWEHGAGASGRIQHSPAPPLGCLVQLTTLLFLPRSTLACSISA